MAGLVDVLVVDDSPTFRAVMSDALADLPQVGTVRAVANGFEALEQVRFTPPHLVALDLQMPGLGGLDTLRLLRQRVPQALIVIVSGVSEAAAVLSVQAIAAGAHDFVAKPEGPDAHERLAAAMAPFVAAAARVAQAAPPEPPMVSVVPGSPRPPPRPQRPGPIDLVVLCSSTGAPSALSRLLPAFSRELAVPVLVHVALPAVFARRLFDHLRTGCSLELCMAGEGRGEASRRILVSTGEPGAAPMDAFLSEVAQRHQNGVLVVMLTGAGQDGLAGLRQLKQAGRNYCIAQGREDCVCSELPDAVWAAGLAEERVPLDALAARIGELVAASD